MSAKLLNQQIPTGGGFVGMKVPDGDAYALIQVFPVPGSPAYAGAVIAFEGAQDAITVPGNPPVLTFPTGTINLNGVRTDDSATQDVNSPFPYTTPAPGFAIPGGISRGWIVPCSGCTGIRLRAAQLTAGPLGVSFQTFGPFAGSSPNPGGGLNLVIAPGTNLLLQAMLFELIESRLLMAEAFGKGLQYQDPTPTIIPQINL